MPRLFVLDALGLAYRAYHAILTRRAKSAVEIAAEKEAARAEARESGKEPREATPFVWEPLRNSRGEPTNAIYGFANSVLKVHLTNTSQGRRAHALASTPIRSAATAADFGRRPRRIRKNLVRMPRW